MSAMLLTVRRMPFAFCLALFCAQSLAIEQGASTSGDALVERRETKSTLEKIQQAAVHSTYHGTVVVSSGGMVVSSRISHHGEGRRQIERIDALDGPPRHVVRYNEQVHTIWPERHVAMVERRDQLSSFPALLQAGLQRIPDFYQLKPMGQERVAGHSAQVFSVRAKDARRYSYRLWSDKSSGLLLRAEVLSDSGDVLESSAFSDVTIGRGEPIESLLQPLKNVDGYRMLRSNFEPARFEAEGWELRSVVPGFQQVSCVKRPVLSPLKTESVSAPEVIQVIYSDGLTYVSLFVEPYHAPRHARPLHTVIGATQTLMKRHGEWWVTLMGDVPASTLKVFADALERRPH